jgi:hypothetical protein
MITKDIDKNSVLKTLLADVFSRTEEWQDENILKLKFDIIDPFSLSPNQLIFSAYMKGFKDNFDASWNEYSYIGRAESFYTYGKYKRNVSFNLDIPCFKKADLIKNHTKLGQLASTTAGSYNDAGLLGGVLIKLNIGNYIKDEYSILNNISYDIPDDSSWDLDAKLAMYVRASLSFTIIHKNLPEYKGKEGFLNYA